jgi:hypothetical protein
VARPTTVDRSGRNSGLSITETCLKVRGILCMGFTSTLHCSNRLFKAEFKSFQPVPQGVSAYTEGFGCKDLIVTAFFHGHANYGLFQPGGHSLEDKSIIFVANIGKTGFQHFKESGIVIGSRHFNIRFLDFVLCLQK